MDGTVAKPIELIALTGAIEAALAAADIDEDDAPSAIRDAASA